LVNCVDNGVEYCYVLEDIEDIVEQLEEGDDPRGSLQTKNTKTSLLLVRHFATELVVVVTVVVVMAVAVCAIAGQVLEWGQVGSTGWCYTVMSYRWVVT
jgi:hypothetical protein